jgi:hypothetical protein
MKLKQFMASWWFWLLCVAAALVRGFLRHWDVTTWCLFGFFAITGVVRFISGRRKKREIS